MASETKWIEGPYSYGYPGVVTPRGHTLCEDWGTIRAADGYPVAKVSINRLSEEELNAHRRAGTDPVAATAHLFKAAPALYEALDDLLSEVMADGLLGHDPEYEAAQKAIAALSQARGEKA